jgi:hypothetical protein
VNGFLIDAAANAVFDPGASLGKNAVFDAQYLAEINIHIENHGMRRWVCPYARGRSSIVVGGVDSRA